MRKNRVIYVRWAFVALCALLVYRLLEIQLFYPYQDEIAAVKRQQVSAPSIQQRRIDLVDRNGESLAVSVDAYAVYISPREFARNQEQKRQLLLDYLSSIGKMRIDADDQRLLPEDSSVTNSRSSIMLARGLNRQENQYVTSLKITGLWSDEYYKRYYPAGEAVAPLVGFVDSDNSGISGLELLYDDELTMGHQALGGLRDGKGNFIKLFANDVDELQTARNPNSFPLSIDLRLQYLAYQHLVDGCRASGAKSGVIITLDAVKGEVLAMAQYPSFNPNNRKNLDHNAVRNRALTDVFEPGSTFKPLILASILEHRDISLDDEVDTNPGFVRVRDVTIRDSSNLGTLSVADVIAKSSNVGISKLSEPLDSMQIIDTLYRMGIGRRTGTMFPGEREGYLPFTPLGDVSKGVISYGYGISLTPLQLAKAYGVLANGGEDFFVTMKKDDVLPKTRAIDEEITDQVLQAMAKVISDGTGKNAEVPGYLLAGKTGTVHKSGPEGYFTDRYVAFFAGIFPWHEPRYVTLVMIDEPQQNRYYAGESAAPIFASYAKDLFALYGILPDRNI